MKKRCIDCDKKVSAKHVKRCWKCYCKKHFKHYRSLAFKNNPLTKKLLKNLYIKLKLSIRKISIQCNCSFTTIQTRLKLWRIPIRTQIEAQKLLIGENANTWKGGRITMTSGYVKIIIHNHPNTNKNYILEHRLVMEKKLGRFLTKNEIVHHINGIRNDNRIENLELRIKGNHGCGHSCIYLKELNRLLKRIK